MAQNFNLHSIIRFTGMSQDYVAQCVATSIYEKAFPVNYARELIHSIWKREGLPDIDRPRIYLWDIRGAFKRGNSTTRKDVARHLPDSRARDIMGKRVFTLREFFKLAKALGQEDWVFDGPGRE